MTLQVTLFPSWFNVSMWSGLDVSWYETNREQFARAWASRMTALDDCTGRSSLESAANEPLHAACSAEVVNVVVTPEAEQEICGPQCSGAITSVTCSYDSELPPGEDDLFSVFADDAWESPKVQATFRDFFAYKSPWSVVTREKRGSVQSMWHGHQWGRARGCVACCCRVNFYNLHHRRCLAGHTEQRVGYLRELMNRGMRRVDESES